MPGKWFVGQDDGEGVMVVGGYEDYRSAKVERDNFNRGNFAFKGQRDPEQYPYGVFHVKEESDSDEE